MTTVLPALEGEHRVGEDIVAAFGRDGFALVRGLATREEVDAYREHVVEATLAHAWDRRPIEERGTYGKAFLQAANLWRRSDAVRALTMSPRFAGVAAALLGVESVALYHDQALCKEPGGGPTPWHQDQHYWPIASPNTITLWLALDDVPPEIGTMTFVPGTHLLGNLVDLGISDESEAAYEQLIASEGWNRVTFGAVSAGDATFHRGWTLHSAGPNPTDRMRPVMTVIYVDAAATVAEPSGDTQRVDHALWLGSRPAGSPIPGPDNPVLHPAR